MEIVYENMSISDHKDVKRLIKQAWFSEYKFSKFIIELYARGYLYIYLSEADYCKVAKSSGKVIGFIFGRSKKIKFFKKLFYKTKLFFVFLTLLFSKAGRRGIRITKITNKVNKILYRSSKVKPKCELVLFIVDKDFRGNSIGSTLEKDFCNYLTSLGQNGVYLFSDTYSNFAFYEKKGYVRCGELEVDFHNLDEDFDGLPKYYIYCKELIKNENL